MFTSAEERLRKENAELHKAIVRKISLAPDPRPVAVIAAYNEKWSPIAAWERLLHELNALTIEESDGQFLEKLQNSGDRNSDLGGELHLRERTTRWLELYPMVSWTLQITAPAVSKIMRIIVGNVADFSAKDITVNSLDYIRDLNTARILRRLKGAFKSIAETSKNIVSLLSKRRLGKLYWVLATVDVEMSEGLAITISDVISKDEDEEMLIPLIEQNVLDASDYIDDGDNFNDGRDPSSLVFGRFIRYVFDRYISSKYVVTGSVMRFLSVFWNKPTYHLDEELAEYFVKSYLEKLKENDELTYAPFLTYFVSPMYVNIWRLVVDYIDQEADENVLVIGIIANHMHRMGDEHLAILYKDAVSRRIAYNYLTHNVRGVPLTIMIRDILEDNDRYLYKDLPVGVRIEIFIRGVLFKKLPLSEYEEFIQQTANDYKKQKQVTRSILKARGYYDFNQPHENFDLIPVFAKYLLPKNQRRVFKAGSDYAEWTSAFLRAIDPTVITTEYWDIVKEKDPPLEVYQTMIDLVGQPPKIFMEGLSVGIVSKLVAVLSVDELREIVKIPNILNILREEPMILAMIINRTGLTLREILSDRIDAFYNINISPENFAAMNTYKGVDLDWNILLNHYLRLKTPEYLSLEILLSHTTPSPYVIASYIPRVLELTLSVNKGRILELIATSAVMKILTLGLRREVQEIIKESRKNPIENSKDTSNDESD